MRSTQGWSRCASAAVRRARRALRMPLAAKRSCAACERPRLVLPCVVDSLQLIHPTSEGDRTTNVCGRAPRNPLVGRAVHADALSLGAKRRSFDSRAGLRDHGRRTPSTLTTRSSTSPERDLPSKLCFSPSVRRQSSPRHSKGLNTTGTDQSVPNGRACRARQCS
jgi:hypothetical protein